MLCLLNSGLHKMWEILSGGPREGFLKCVIAAVLSCTARIQCAALFVREVSPGQAESLPEALP